MVRFVHSSYCYRWCFSSLPLDLLDPVCTSVPAKPLVDLSRARVCVCVWGPRKTLFIFNCRVIYCHSRYPSRLSPPPSSLSLSQLSAVPNSHKITYSHVFLLHSWKWCHQWIQNDERVYYKVSDGVVFYPRLFEVSTTPSIPSSSIEILWVYNL